MKNPTTPAGEPLEIERKFLIRRPAEELLRQHSSGWLDMEQIYLTRRQRGENRRIRCSVRDGEARYHYNEKIRLSSVTRIEREWEISEEEYAALWREADPECAVITKRRWLIPHGELIVADSAERKSIADYRALGLNCRGARKGPGSVGYSVKWLQSLAAIVIDPEACPHAAREFAAWRYIDGALPETENHHIDAVRYATGYLWHRGS